MRTAAQPRQSLAQVILVSKSVDKGTRWETAIVNYINAWFGKKICHRVVKHGKNDEGDIILYVDDLVLSIEAKWNKTYPNAALERDFRRQTDIECLHAGTDGGLLVVNLYRKQTDRAEVWMHHATACLLHGEKPVSGNTDYDWECMRMEDFCTLCFGPRRER